MDEDAYRRHTGSYVGELLDSGRHPYLRRVVEDAEHDPDQDAVFERRLAMVLDGIAATIDPREAEPTSSIAPDRRARAGGRVTTAAVQPTDEHLRRRPTDLRDVRIRPDQAPAPPSGLLSRPVESVML